MLVLLQTAIPADGTVVEEGFSKLQVFLQQLIDWGVAAGGNIIGAILIFVIGRFLISLIKKMVSKLLEKRHVDAGIQSFVKSLVNILLTILLIIAVIGKLGVETTSFAALLASAGVAIGIALSGNLYGTGYHPWRFPQEPSWRQPDQGTGRCVFSGTSCISPLSTSFHRTFC